jgi:hypothetical protein
MFRLSFLLSTTIFAMDVCAQAQMVITMDDTNDAVIAFSPVDGSFLGTLFPLVAPNQQPSIIQVGGVIWSSEQNND